MDVDDLPIVGPAVDLSQVLTCLLKYKEKKYKEKYKVRY